MVNKLSWTSSLLDLKLSPQMIEGLQKLGLKTCADLLTYTPRRFEDYSKVTEIKDLKPGRVMIKGAIIEAKGRYLGYRGLHLTEALAQDDSGQVRLIWFNQPYRASSLKLGELYYLYGQYDLKYRHLQLINPSTYLADSHLFSEDSDFIKPIYGATKGLKSDQIQKLIQRILPVIEKVEEVFPQWLLEKAQLSPLKQILGHLHFPPSMEAAQTALRQTALRELIVISLSSQLLKTQLRDQKAQKIVYHRSEIQKVIKQLPFALTKDQKRITKEILNELEAGQKPLNHLVQGDVGAGKTLIALLIAFNVILDGHQVVFLAPTQILVQQHYRTVLQILKDFLAPEEVAILMAKQPAKERKRILEGLKSGQIKLIIGTQALLFSKIKFKKLALTIIDEQHRFGVHQRLKLLHKTRAQFSHILTLSATPIPRSLALVLYAELNISLLKDMPPGRQPVATSVIPLKERPIRLQAILKTASSKNKIYIVCPVIEENDKSDSLAEIEVYLQKIQANLKLVVLHGRQESATKEQIVAEFTGGQYDVLLSTSVIEAGLDISSANTIIIMSPERFGLAQLHQLRGRVGRRREQAYCYLCPLSNDAPSDRLQALLDHENGFILSELDLKLRGPGTLYGLKQSGLPEISKISLLDAPLIKLATDLACQFVAREDINNFKKLHKLTQKYQEVTHLN